MEINYFTEFITLAKIGNFTEAAEELYLSQASLSKHIKSMEKELGELLFYRTTKKLELTEYGQLLLEDAQKISELQVHYTEQLDDYKRNRPQVLRLGSIHMMPHYGITNLLSGFSQSFPQIHLEIFNNREDVLAHALVQKKCELAFMRFCPLPEKDVVKIPLVQDHFCFVLSKNHPLADASKLSLKELTEEQFILFSTSNGTPPLYQKFFDHAAFTPLIRLHLSNYVNILDLVGYNVGITVMTERTARYLAGDKHVIIPADPLTPLELSLFYLKKPPLSPVAKKFAAFVKGHT